MAKTHNFAVAGGVSEFLLCREWSEISASKQVTLREIRPRQFCRSTKGGPWAVCSTNARRSALLSGTYTGRKLCVSWGKGRCQRSLAGRFRRDFEKEQLSLVALQESTFVMPDPTPVVNPLQTRLPFYAGHRQISGLQWASFGALSPCPVPYPDDCQGCHSHRPALVSVPARKG